jgi:hypothetical protein
MLWEVVVYTSVDYEWFESGNGAGFCIASKFLVVPQCNVLGRLDLMLRHGRDVHPTWVKSLLNVNTKESGSEY